MTLPLSNVVGEVEGGCCSGPFSVESEGKVKENLESVWSAFITWIYFLSILVLYIQNLNVVVVFLSELVTIFAEELTKRCLLSESFFFE